MFNPFDQPLYITLKPAGPRCNLACKYCYYLEKEKLFDSDDNASPRMDMSDELLEKFVKEYIESQTGNEVLFLWHGGEPLLRPLSFYKKAMALERKYGRGRQISNCLQTNGLLLSDEWCRFLHNEGWLVGLSIDGTEDMHNRYRRNKVGDASYHRLIENIRMMQYYGVEWNAMVTVHQGNVERGKEMYRFLKQLGASFIQLSPVVERKREGNLLTYGDSGEDVTEESVRPEQWGKFLCDIFDEWVHHDVGDIFVEIFDCTLANWMGVMPGICIFAENCGHAGVMEWNGDVYSCDHFVFPEYRLGNIYKESLINMMYGERQQTFRKIKRTFLADRCKECEWLFACHGECPKNRFAKDENGKPGMNYLCEGYKMYFKHVAPYMDVMKKLLNEGKEASEIMKYLLSDLPEIVG